MGINSVSTKLDRRTVIKAAAAAGVAQFAAPFVITARAADTLKIGMINPFTGVYAAVSNNELIGAKFAVEQVNAKGGILGRQVELLTEDSANDVGTGVQKAQKLIDRDQVTFLMADVNSGIAQAIAQVSNEKKVLHIVPGGHTDPITGTDCHWNVFRVCNTTAMEANSVAPEVFKRYGKKWYFITPDYAFGHTLEAAAKKNLANLGGTVVGDALTPLGTTDFSAYLIQAKAANPDVILVLPQGGDMVNCMKQIAQFGIGKQIHIAGLQQEEESLIAMPPEARTGTWMFEWYWKQPGVPHVEQFVAEIRKRSGGHVPTARTWFGYTALWTFKLVTDKAKTLDAVKLAKALGGMELPPEIKLQPNKVYYAAGDHQLRTSSFVGHAVETPASADPEDLFVVESVVPGDKTSPPDTETGCKFTWPA